MELTNKREIYSVSNTGTTLKLSGEITIVNGSDVISFNGVFTTIEGTQAGSFNYRETNNIVDKNIYGVPSEFKNNAESLIDSTAELITIELGL